MFRSIINNTVSEMCKNHKSLKLNMINGNIPVLTCGSGETSCVYLASVTKSDMPATAFLFRFFNNFITCAESNGEMEGVRLKPAMQGKSVTVIPFVPENDKNSLLKVAEFIKNINAKNVFLIKSGGNSVSSFSSRNNAETSQTVCKILSACGGFEPVQRETDGSRFLKAINKTFNIPAYLICTEELKYSAMEYHYLKYCEAMMISALI